MIHAHERNVHVLMKAIDTAVKRAAGELKPESRKLEEEKKGEKKEGENVDREKEKDGVSTLPESKASGNPQKTTVIVSISGRHMKDDGRQDKCSWHINRVVTHQAHKHGFVVLEREEIEHRLLYRSEHNPDIKAVNPDVHLDIPGPQIVGTALLKLLECITKNESEYKYVVQDPFYTTIKLD